MKSNKIAQGERLKIAVEQMNKAMSSFALSFGERNLKALRAFSIAANKHYTKHSKPC